MHTRSSQEYFKTESKEYWMNINHENSGCREGFSTIDNLHALSQLKGKANNYQLELCVCYIDYKKAFDLIEHSDLFTTLRKVYVRGR